MDPIRRTLARLDRSLGTAIGSFSESNAETAVDAGGRGGADGGRVCKEFSIVVQVACL